MGLIVISSEDGDWRGSQAELKPRASESWHPVTGYLIWKVSEVLQYLEDQ